MVYNQTVHADGSFVKISSIDAQRMALKTLKWVDDYRAERRESAIQAEQKKLDNGFWHKLFRMKPTTREEAIASLENDPWDLRFHCPSIMYGKTEDTATRILNACKHADEIYISTEDLNRISQ